MYASGADFRSASHSDGLRSTGTWVAGLCMVTVMVTLALNTKSTQTMAVQPRQTGLASQRTRVVPLRLRTVATPSWTRESEAQSRPFTSASVTESSFSNPGIIWSTTAVSCAMAVLFTVFAVRRFTRSGRVDAQLRFACFIVVRGSDIKTVVVAGATGRTGTVVVSKLLEREGSAKIRALVRNPQKAQELLPKSDRLEVVICDVSDPVQLTAACKDADAVIWCGTALSTPPPPNPLDDFFKMFGKKIEQPPPVPVDTQALRTVSEAMKVGQDSKVAYPRVVMCSSAAVTRLTWPEDKKKKLLGASDIPIVRLNPFGVLDRKREAEQILRDSGVSYTIVRPTGLNADQKPGRPIFSQGDVAVGRISREDVAEVLIRLLFEEPDCVGKTMEVLSLPDLPSPRSFQLQLSRLLPDTKSLDEAAVEAQYHILQQLLPGEMMEANQLAMGQTYEQLDRNETGRLGKRGEEVVPGAQAFGN